MTTSNGIPDLTAIPAEGGFIYQIDANSAGYQWKLSSSAPGVVWTDENYSVLEDCVGLTFNDVDVELGPDGEVRVVPKGEDFASTMADAPDMHDGFVRRGSAEPIVDAVVDPGFSAVANKIAVATRPLSSDPAAAQTVDLSIPAQFDDLGSEVSFDIATFLPEALLSEGLQLSFNGLPPGLRYNVARMRIEGTIADDAMTGQPYSVAMVLALPDGSLMRATFQWTVRDATAVDAGAKMTSVVPASGNRDEAAAAGILMTVATHGILAGTSLSLSARADAATPPAAGSGRFELSDLGSSAAAGLARGAANRDAGASIDNLVTGSIAGATNGRIGSGADRNSASALESRDGSQQVRSDDGSDDVEVDGPDQAPISSQLAAQGADVGASGGTGVTNARPFAGTPAPQTVLEETLRSDIDVLSAAFDVDGDILSVVSAEASNGQVAILEDGRLSYLPNALFNGDDTIIYQITDGKGGTDNGTVSVTVLPVNDDPTVGAFTNRPTQEDVPIINIDVLSNALDVDSTTLSVTQASALNGIVSINADGTLSYQPNADFNGSDAITFTVSDGDGGTGIGTIPVTVSAQNDAPNPGTPPTSTVAEDFAVNNIDVLGSATDVDGDLVTLVGGSVTALNGFITENPDGTFNYTPAPNFNGTDTVTYELTDGSGLTSTGSVNVVVTPVNDAPNPGSPVDLTTSEDAPIASIDVLQFATDIDLDVLVLNPASLSATSGTVTINGDGTLRYVPNSNFVGTDTVSYSVDDQAGGLTSASFQVTVTGVNDAPVTTPVPSVTTSEDVAVASIDVLSFASDSDGDVLSVDPASLVATNGSLSLNGDGSLLYTPNTNYFGNDLIFYTIRDGNGGTVDGTISLSVSAVNDAPNAGFPATVFTPEDTPLPSINVLSFASDVDGDPVSVQLGSVSAINGVASINPDGSLNYTPSLNFNGIDTITYTLEDGNGGTVAGSVRVNVNSGNDDPVAGSPPSVATGEDVGFTGFDVLSVATDSDGDILSVQPGSGSALNGTVTVNPDSTINYTPNANFNGTDTITYLVVDGNGGSDTGSLTVTVAAANDAPDAGFPAGQATLEDTPLTGINVLSAASDLDGDTLVVTPGSVSATNGVVVLNGDGTIDYTPNADFNGSDTITYTVEDPSGATASGSVDVSVGAINDAPLLDLSDVQNEVRNGTFTDTLSLGDWVDWTETGLFETAGDGANAPAVSQFSPQTLTQTGLTNLNTGPAASGSAILAFDLGWSETTGALPNPLGLEVYVAGTRYAVIETSPGTTGNLTYTYENGATGTTTAIPAGIALDYTYGQVAIELPATVPATGNLEFRWVEPPVLGSFDDISIDNVQVIRTADNLATTGHSVTYEDGAEPVRILDQTATLTDADGGGLVGASISLTNMEAGDELLIGGASVGDGMMATIGSISYLVTIGGGTFNIALSGIGTTSDYLTALNAIEFQSNSGSPVNTNRIITIQVDDGTDMSNVATTTVVFDVTAQAPSPSADSASGSEDTPIAIDVLLNDAAGANPIDPATVQLQGTANPGDSLVVVGEGTWSVNAISGVLTFTPEANFNGTVTTVAYTVADTTGYRSSLASVDLTLAPVNDAPVLDLNGVAPGAGFAVNFTEGAAPVAVASGTASVTDIETGIQSVGFQIAGATDGAAEVMSVGGASFNLAADFTTIIAVSGTPVTLTYVESSRTLTANHQSGTGTPLTLGEAEALVRSITYENTSNLPTVGDRVLDFWVVDMDGTPSAIPQSVVTVGGVNDAPTDITYPSAVVSENATAGTVVAVLSAVDADSVGPFAFSLTNDPSGFFDIVGNSIVVASGANIDFETSTSHIVDVQVLDPQGASYVEPVTITVTNSNEPPVASPLLGTMQEDGAPEVFDVTSIATDPEGDTLTVLPGSPSATNGSVVINGGGDLVYTPDADFNGTDTITYTLSDGNGGTNSGSVTVTVTAINDNPVAGTPAAQSTGEDTAIASIDVLSAASDVDGDALSVQPGSPSALNGSVIVNGDGTLQYTPNANFQGSDTISYTVEDGNGGSVPGTVDVTVTPQNDPPTPNTPPAATTAEDTAIASINVLAVATDPEGDALSIAPGSVSAVNGSVVINGDDTLQYTPNADFNGTDTITYTVQDTNGGTAVGSLTVNVTPVNDPPLVDLNGGAAGRDFAVTFTEGDSGQGVAPASTLVVDDDNAITTIRMTVSGLQDGGSERFSMLGSNISLAGSGSGTIIHSTFSVDYTYSNATGVMTLTRSGGGTFTAAEAEEVIEPFEYQNTSQNPTETDRTFEFVLQDADGLLSPVATTTLSVVAVNDAPIVPGSSQPTGTEDTPTLIDVLATASDVDGTLDLTSIQILGTTNPGDPLTVPGEGVWTINTSTGTITFAPETNFSGLTSTIQYVIADDQGLVSDPVNLSVNVTPVNDPPVVDWSAVSVGTDHVANYLPGTGSQSVSDANVVISDDSTAFDRIQLSISGLVNSPAEVLHFTSADSIFLGGGTSTTVDYGGSLVVDLTYSRAGSSGTVVITPQSGTFTASDVELILELLQYEHTATLPTPGPREIAVTVRDVEGETSNAAESVLNVGAGNGVPVVDLNGSGAGQDFSATYTEGNSPQEIVDPLVSVNDLEDALSSVVIDIAFLSDSIDRLYMDGTSLAPTISQSGTTSSTASPLSFTYDDVARQLTIRDVGGPSVAMTNAQVQEVLGLITFETTGFNPPAGDRTFDVTVTDMAGQSSAVTTSTVTVVPVNNAPVAIALNGPNDEDTSVTFLAAASATDADGTIDPALTQIVGTTNPGDPLVVGGQGTWTIDTGNGQITFTPLPDFDGVVTPIQYVVGDDLGALSAPQTIDVTMVAINDAPVATNLGLSLPQGSSFVLDVFGTTTDVDGTIDPTTIQITGTALAGDSLTVLGEGVWSVDTGAGTIVFTPEPLFTGQATPISYRVSDNLGQVSNVASGDVEVQPVANTAPTLDLSNSNPANGVVWSHNITANRAQAEIMDPLLVTSASDYTLGAGITGTTPVSYFEFSGAGSAGTTFANAVLQDDYVEYAFVAERSSTLSNITYSSFNDTGSYQIGLEISDDGFATSTNLLTDYQHVAANAGDFSVDFGGGGYMAVRSVDVSDFSLTAGQSYAVRAYFYDAVASGPYGNGEGVFDDLQLQMEAVGVDNGNRFFGPGLGVVSAPSLLVDPLAGVLDAEDNVVSVSLTAGGIVEPGNEQISIGGTAFTFDSDQTFTGIVAGGTAFDVNYTAATQTFVISNNAGPTIAMPIADLNSVLRTIGYEDYSPTTTPGLRTFSFAATDGGGATSNGATATISVQVPVVALSQASPFADTLFGTSNADFIRAQGADDTVDGGDGDDFLFGQDGGDTLIGAAGNDRLVGDNIFVDADIVQSQVILNNQTLGNQSAPTVVSLENGNVLVVWYGDADAPSPGALSVREFSADGTPAAALITGLTAPSGGDYHDMPVVSAARLSNGNVLVTWATDAASGFGGADENIAAVVYDVNTQALTGGESMINTSTAGAQSGPLTIALNDGGALVIWYDNADLDGLTNIMRGQVLDATGTPVGPERFIGDYAVETSDSRDFAPVTGSVLSNGNVAIVYMTNDAASADGSQSAVAATVFNPTTQLFTSDVIVNATTTGAQSSPTIVALSNGSLFVTWYGSADGDGAGGMSLLGRIVNNDGSLGSSEFPVSTTLVEGFDNNDMPPVTAIELADGNIMVGFQTDTSQAVDGPFSAAVMGVVVDVVALSGGTEFVINSTLPTDQSGPILVPLHDGRVFATWYDDSDQDDTGNMQVRGQFLEMDGTLSGPELMLGMTDIEGNATSGNGPDSFDMPPLTATLTENGDVFVSWVSEDGFNADGSGSAVMSVLVKTATTSGDDSLIGGAGDDVLIGGGGDDFLQGGADNDTLYGGEEANTPALVTINETSLGNQSAPQTIALDDGNILVVWYGNAFSADAGNLSGRILGADGSAVSAEFSIGTVPVEGNDVNDGAPVSLANLGGGNVFISWMSEQNHTPNPDGSGQAVLGSVVNVSTQSAGPEFTINQNGSGEQSAPVSVSLDDGRALVFWWDDARSQNGLSQVNARFINSDGSPDGASFLVGTAPVEGDSDYDQPRLDAVQFNNGNVLVSWQSDDTPDVDGDGTAVVAAMIDTSTNSAGSQFTVNTTTASNQSGPVTLALSDGRGLVVWYDNADRDNSMSLTIRGQFLQSNGAMDGTEFEIVGSDVEGLDRIQMDHLTAHELENGNVIVGWQSEGLTNTDGDSTAAAAAIVDVTSRTAGTPFVINTFNASAQSAPVFASFGNGQMLAVWVDDSETVGTDEAVVRGQILDETGFPIGDEFELSAVTAHIDLTLDSPNVSLTSAPDGSVFVSWISNSDQAVDGDGTAVVGIRVTAGFTTDDDTLIGDGGIDLLYGGDGEDVIEGGAGIDFLSGGDGDDTLDGQNGDDTLDGGWGADALDGGIGNDTVDYSSANSGVVAIFSSTDASGIDGNFTTFGAGGYQGDATGDTYSSIETVLGTLFDDQIYGSSAGMTASLSNGNDVFDTGSTNSVFDVTGGAGDDRIFTSNGNDILRGGSGNDTLVAAGGDDTLEGGSGDDTLTGGAGADVHNGGSGVDTASYFSASAGIDLLFSSTNGADSIWGSFLNTSAGGYAGDAVGDTFNSIAAVSGTQFNDRIYGLNGGMDAFLGGGDDNYSVASASTGVDNITGGLGNDRIFTGGGDDFLYGNDGDDELDGGTGSDELYGMGDNDTLRGGQGNDDIYGGAGDDNADGGQGSDRLFGEAGNDTLSGGLNDDELYGNDGDDILNGGENRDRVFGGNGNDTVNGDAGNDDLFGEEGADTLAGGAGDDDVDGGNGLDSAFFSGNLADYTITDLGSNTYRVVDNRPGSPDGTDRVVNVENFVFADMTLHPGVSPDAPSVDLDSNELGNNNMASFFVGQTPTRMVSENFSVTDPQNDVVSVRIVIAGAVDGADDQFNFGTSNFALSADFSGTESTVSYDIAYNYVAATGVMIVANNTVGAFTAAELSAAMLDIAYSNTSANPTESDRTFTITFEDLAGNVSAPAVTTISVIDDTPSPTTNTLTGTSGPDSALDGTSANDEISGLSGDDVIQGLSGDDYILASSGLDVIDGGAGNDYIEAGLDNDTANGGDGNDVVRLGEGDNVGFGGSGNDAIYGATGADTVTGGAGDDLITLLGGIDTAVYSGNRADYEVHDYGGGVFVVIDQRPGSPDGRDELQGVDNLQFADQTITIGTAVTTVSPVALDLNRSGAIEVTGETTAQDKTGVTEIGDTVEFDMDADGDLETIEWLDGSGDALLVDNRDGSAMGDMDGARLFGDQGGQYDHGYQQLSELDADGDGALAGDELDGLSAWIDDGDAHLEEGELFTVQELGVSEISVALEVNVQDDAGRDLFRSTATMEDGSKIVTEDVWFAQVDLSHDQELTRPRPEEPHQTHLDDQPY
ncbi:MAG: tandem-95 repeat protein [Pseudomonadota bacterium]